MPWYSAISPIFHVSSHVILSSLTLGLGKVDRVIGVTDSWMTEMTSAMVGNKFVLGEQIGCCMDRLLAGALAGK